MNSEKKYKEAINRAKILIEKLEANHIKGFIYHIFPELLESNEDRIKREILELVSIAGNGNQYEEIKDWLEKQSKNITYREYVFRPLPGDTIEQAAEKVVKLNGKIVLAFNGAYIPVRNKTKDEIVAEYRNWVKKQSEKPTIKDLEDLFQALPEKIFDINSHQTYELSIYHYDGKCVVDYVGELDHSSLYTFDGDTLYDAIEKTWNWLRKDSTGG